MAGTLEADRITAAPGWIQAEGGVSLSLDGHRLEASSLHLIEKEEKVFAFTAEEVWWTPCTCERVPWAVSAAEGSGVVGESLVLKKAMVRVCGAPVFPVPWARVALNPRSPRLLLPEVQYGESGGVFGQPVWLPVGDRSHARLTPEVWTDRGFRQRALLAGPAGRAKVAVAKEGAAGPERGQVDVAGGIDDGDYWAAVDTQWTSDAQVLNDYSTDFFERSTPYQERRLVVGMGPARVESDTFDDSTLDRPVGAVLALSGLALGPLAVSGQARVDALLDHQAQQSLQRSGFGLSVAGGHGFDVLDTELTLDLDAAQLSNRAPFGQARLTAGGFLPLWGDLGAFRHISQTGLEARGTQHEGKVDDPLQWIRPEPRWAVGPVQRTTVLSVSGVPLHMSAELMRTPYQWEPAATLRLDSRGFRGSAQLERDLQAAVAGYADEGVDLSIGVVHGAGVLQSMAGASALLRPQWRPGWSGLFDHTAGELVRHGPTLTWDSGCDCLSVRLAGEWARDRTMPDVMIRVDLRPTTASDRYRQ